MNIEAKRESQDSHEQEGSSKRVRVADEVRDDAWFARTHHAFIDKMQHIFVKKHEEDSGAALSTVAKLRQYIDVDTLYVDLTPDTVDDFEYLTIFPQLKRVVLSYLYFTLLSRDNSDDGSDGLPDLPKLVPMILRGVHLDETAIVELTIHTNRFVISMSESFAQSLRKIQHLILKCPLSLRGNVVMDMPVLRQLMLGTYRTEDDRQIEHTQSIVHVQDGWFKNLSALETLTINNCFIKSSHIPLIGSNITALTLQFVDIRRIPSSWNALRHLERLSLINTTFTKFDSSQFHPLAQLTHLTLANKIFLNYELDVTLEDEVYNEYVMRNTIREAVMYNLPKMVSVSFLNVGINDLILGREPIDDAVEHDAPFRQLEEIHLHQMELDDVTRLSIRTTMFPQTWLPKLSSVSIKKRNLMEHPGDPEPDEVEPLEFPPFLIGILTMKFYNGPFHWPEERNIVNVDRFMDTSVYSFSIPYLIILKYVLKYNRRTIKFTSNNGVLFRHIERLYIEIEEDRIRNREMRARRIEEDRVRREQQEHERRDAQQAQQAQVVEMRTLTEQMSEQLRTAILSHAVGRMNVPPHRVEPYFIRYSSTIQCTNPGITTPSPFVPDTRGRMPICIICRTEFDKNEHDADATEIIDNSFLTRRNALEIDYQENRLGCVVVCNVLDSDFSQNAYVAQPDESYEQAVHRVQCTHRNHFYHRVCFSTSLYDEMTARGFFRCFETSTKFFPRPREELEREYQQRQEDQVDREVHLMVFGL